MRRTLAALLAVTAIATGCGPDVRPVEAMVGLRVRGCDPGVDTGSGMFVTVPGVDEPLVLTAAHTLRNAREIVVTRGDERAAGAGTIVAFDPDMDLAYLRVDGLTSARPLPVDSAAIEGGEAGVAYVVRDGERVGLPLTIRRRVNIRTEDIYVDADTLRPGYELRVDIDAGDSGGAVVVDGRVVGVVWARSRRDTERAWAIDPVRAGDLVREQLRIGELGDVDLTRCR